MMIRQAVAGKRGVRGFKVMERIPILVLALLVVVFAILSPTFLRVRNLIEILQFGSVFLLLAAGETFPILMGSIDLSIGGMIVASGVLAATLEPSGGPVTAILMVVIALGLGILNGVIIVKLKLPSFIVTLAASFIFAGVGIALTEGYNIAIRSNQFSWISSGRIVPGIPNMIIWAAVVYFFFVVLSERTRTGRYLFAIGGKEDVATRMGISIDKYRILAFGLCGLFVGVATLLLAARLGMASGRLGTSYLFNTLIAVVLGGTALSGGVGGLKKTFIGVFILAVMENGMTLTAVDVRIQNIIKAAVLILAVYLSSISSRDADELMK